MTQYMLNHTGDKPVPHSDSRFCWCFPVLWFVAENGAEIWLHNNGPNADPPTPQEVAAAIATAWNGEGQ